MSSQPEDLAYIMLKTREEGSMQLANSGDDVKCHRLAQAGK